MKLSSNRHGSKENRNMHTKLKQLDLPIEVGKASTEVETLVQNLQQMKMTLYLPWV